MTAVNIAEAAAYFKVSKSLMYQRFESGELDDCAYRIGTAIRFDLDKLIEHFSRSRVGGVGPKRKETTNGQPT